MERIHEIVEREGRQLPGRGECGDPADPVLDCGSRAGGAPGSALRSVFGAEHVTHTSQPLTGSEDFSYIAQEVPAFFCWVGAGKPGNPPLHNPNVILDERALDYGVKTMASLPFFWAGGPAT